MPYKVTKDDRCEAGKPFGVVKETDNELMGCHATESDAHDQMAALYANEPGAGSGSMMSRERAPIEYRSASVDSVNHDQRIITVLAVPWESPGTVLYRGEVWNEIFVRGAFNGLESMPNRVKANRDHDKTKPVGKAINFWPQHDKGLLAEIKVSRTWRGDETLALADDRVLGVSVGYAAPADREHTLFDRQKMERRVIKAYLDHISFVTDPAFVDAQVVSVREMDQGVTKLNGGPPFPNLDQVVRNDFLSNMAQRLAERKHGE